MQWTISVVLQGKRDGYFGLKSLVKIGEFWARILHGATQIQLMFSAYLKKIWKNVRNP